MAGRRAASTSSCPGTGRPRKPAERQAVRERVPRTRYRFTYTYDLGDNWEHQVLIERTQPALDAGRYPACVAGRRNCPPEDCGGPWGYAELLAAIADPAHPEHADQRAWLGEDFDLEEFDVDAADADM